MSTNKSKKTNIKGNTEKPRLTVFRSRTNIYAQIVDDTSGKTICSASSMKAKSGKQIEIAHTVGKSLAEEAKKKKISKIVFDRGRYVYKGRVKALAEGAREGGLEF